jgi:hypothetical protein
LRTTLRISLASIACAAVVAGCTTNEQGQLVIDPNKVNEVLASALAPPPPPPPVVVEEAYQPMPSDVYVSAVVDHDVVLIGGDTYIWVVEADGVRHRHFYSHGDHREDVFHRRDELHRVMTNHGGHLPDHATAHSPMGHPGGPDHPAPAGQNHSVPVSHAAVSSRSVPASKPAAKDPKKS